MTERDITEVDDSDDTSQARLALHVSRRPWRLNAATRERGRRGVAEARAALKAAIREHHLAEHHEAA